MQSIKELILISFLGIALVSCSRNENNPAVSKEPTGVNDIAVTDGIGSNEPSEDLNNDINNLTENHIPEDNANVSTNDILIVYFSRVGNTDFASNVDANASASINTKGSDLIGNCNIVADYVQQMIGGDIYLIETSEKYPSNYQDTTNVARTEQNNESRPTLSNEVSDMQSYNTVVLIYPNWWGTLPQPVFTFLEAYDFAGKTILPIATHEGSGLGRGPSDISKVCPDAILKDGLAIRGSRVENSETDIRSWIEGLELEMK